MNEQVINEVFSTYEVLNDTINVTTKTIRHGLDYLHETTAFGGELKDNSFLVLNNARLELDDIMVLSLFAAFERELRISIKNVIADNTNKSNTTIERLCELTIESIERWTITDLIDSLKDVVDGSTRGKVKQIYEYRNWVAHGKSQDKLPSAMTTPQTVWDTLRDFINQASDTI